MIFCWSGVSLVHVSLEMTSGSNMNQIALLRAVVTAFEFSDSRKLMSDVLEVSAASSTPLTSRCRSRSMARWSPRRPRP